MEEVKRNPNRVLIQAGWAHAPHLSQDDIEDMKRSTPPHLIDARMNGNPTMGAGNVYPIPRSMIECDPFQVPSYWKRLAGLDVGFNVTAAVFIAHDTQNDVVYVYDEYHGEKQNPASNAAGIRHRTGKWMPIMIDPASRGRSQVDGVKLITEYRKEDLDVRPADNAVEAGIFAVWQRLQTGRLKIFKTCHHTLSEYETYQRDEDGKIVKRRDHHMDACFTEETEVLTINGWVSLKEVTEDDVIFAVDSDGNGMWEKPQRVIHKTWTGDVYSIKHPHLEFTATSDHQHAVISQYDWKVKKRFKLQARTVDSLFGEMYFPNNIVSWPEGPGVFEQGKDEAYIMGMWLAEGCYRKARPTFIVLDQKKEPQLSKIKAALKNLGWRYSKEVKKESGITRIEISEQKARVVWMRSMFGEYSHSKRCPVWLLNQMTHEERVALFEGYMDGDGCVNDHCWHYDSTSEQLVDDMQVLAGMLGYGSRKLQYEYMKAGPRKVMGVIRDCADVWRVHVHVKKPCAHISKQLFKKETVVDLPVHCVTTSTGYFFARTNGKPFVAGNCRYSIMGLAHAKLPYTEDPYGNYEYKNPYQF